MNEQTNMKVPALKKTREEVAKEYNREQSERECTALSHAIDTEGSCACGYYIEGKASGSFPFVPNRATRRRLMGGTKQPRYVLSDEDRERLREERERDQSRREIRERARLSRRQERDRQPPVSVSLLVGAEAREAEEG